MRYLNLPRAALIRFPPQSPPWMLILFDHVTPGGIARFLPGHTVTKAKDRGWDTLTNGSRPRHLLLLIIENRRRNARTEATVFTEVKVIDQWPNLVENLR